MAQHGKKYRQAVQLIEEGRLYSLDEAVELLSTTSTTKFDPTVEIHFNLELDPKYADQMIRTTITLPNGSGRAASIGAFTDQGNEKELIAAGASVAGGDDLIEAVAAGKIDFGVAIATPGMMKKMGKIAKVLGPKGLMPNPKTGTVGEDLLPIVAELRAGKFEFKNDKQGNVHSIVGKLSFGPEKLKKNIEYFIQTIKDVKPSGAKSGKYLNTIVLCTSMGPGIPLQIVV
ncbi:MAG TPA: 50S ribosomal protein L1 [bacterium]|nr:50S ribosomal protein L1 [bacterium]